MSFGNSEIFFSHIDIGDQSSTSEHIYCAMQSKNTTYIVETLLFIYDSALCINKRTKAD